MSRSSSPARQLPEAVATSGAARRARSNGCVPRSGSSAPDVNRVTSERCRRDGLCIVSGRDWRSRWTSSSSSTADAPVSVRRAVEPLGRRWRGPGPRNSTSGAPTTASVLAAWMDGLDRPWRRYAVAAVTADGRAVGVDLEVSGGLAPDEATLVLDSAELALAASRRRPRTHDDAVVERQGVGVQGVVRGARRLPDVDPRGSTSTWTSQRTASPSPRPVR